MSERFIKLIDSEKTDWLQEYHPNCYLLLTYLSRRARTQDDSFDGLLRGEAFTDVESTSKKCGLSPKQYRLALIHLEEKGFIETIWNPDWTKAKNHQCQEILAKLENFKKRAIKRATKSKIIKITNSDICDISFENKGNQKGKPRASKGQAEGNKQDLREGRDIKEEHPPTPNGGGVVVFEFLKEIKPEFLSEKEKQKLSLFDEAKVKRGLMYCERIEIKTTLYRTMNWFCTQENEPKIKLTNEEIFEINKNYVSTFSEKKNDKAKFQIHRSECEIIPFGQCNPKVFNYGDKEPEKFAAELQDTLRAYGLE